MGARRVRAALMRAGRTRGGASALMRWRNEGLRSGRLTRTPSPPWLVRLSLIRWRVAFLVLSEGARVRGGEKAPSAASPLPSFCLAVTFGL